MDMNEATAAAIRSERSIASITVRELAERSGIPERSLMRILQGERDIKVNQVDQIAAALRIYPHELIETAENLMERSERPVTVEAEPIRPRGRASTDQQRSATQSQSQSRPR